MSSDTSSRLTAADADRNSDSERRHALRRRHRHILVADDPAAADSSHTDMTWDMTHLVRDRVAGIVMWWMRCGL